MADTWQQGDAYERYVGRWSRPVAAEFLRWLRMPAGRRWLDVGCGTGALCEAILQQASPASVTGVEPSPGFLESARARLGGRATFAPGSAEKIPLADGATDVTVSALVLNFVPDLGAAFREMSRVTVAGGTVAGYVWDYAGRMQLMRLFWDAAIELDADAARMDEGVRFDICRPEALLERFHGAGLTDVETMAIEVPTPFDSFEDYWSPFLGGQGPAPAYAMSLDAPDRDRLRERLRARVPVRPDGSIALIARAWAARGTVAGH